MKGEWVMQFVGESGMPAPLYAIAAFCPRSVHSPAPLTGFIFIHSQTAKFRGCSPPHLMWEFVTQGHAHCWGVRGWWCETMDMSCTASTILRYVCPHLVDNPVKRQLVSEVRDAGIAFQSNLEIKDVRHWSTKRQRQFNCMPHARHHGLR